MKKHLQLLALLAALLLPWAMQAQTPCTITVGPGNPYYEGFESTNGSAYNTAGVLPTCWTGYSNGTTAAYVPHVTSGGSSYSYYHTGAKSLVMTSGSATYGTTKQAVFPEFSLPLNQLQVSFWMCTESSSSGVLSVGYLTNATDTSSFVTIQNFPACAATVHSGNGLQAAGKGAIYEVVMNNVPATAQRLAFRWSHTATSYFSCCIDDVTVEVLPNCFKPTTLTATNIGATSIDLAWSDTNAYTNGYRLFYYPSNNESAIDSVDFYFSSDTSYQLTQLQPNTAYTIQIATICSDYSLSSRRTIAVRTSCVPISRSQMPYVYGFEDASASGSAGTISPCWNKGTNYSTAYPYPYSTYKKSGTYSLYFYSTSGNYYSYAVMPPVEDSVQDLQVTFSIYRTSTTAGYGDMQVGVMTDPADYTTFTQVGTTTYNPSATSTWEEFTVSLASYTGSGLYVAFRKPATAAGNTALDDVTLEVVPACPRVENLTVSNITTNSASLNWTEMANGTSWTVEYGPEGFTLGTGSYAYATDTTVTITGLSANTPYDVYVTVDCGSDVGGTNMAQFRTKCSALDSLPVTYDFDSYATGTSAAFPSCWNRINDATGSYNYYPYVYNSSTYAHSGSNCLYFYSTTTSTYASNMYGVLPAIDVTVYPINTLQMSFWGRGSSTASYDASIRVGVMTDPTDASTFVQVANITMNSTLTEYMVDFSSYTGTGSYIAFYKQRGTTTGYAYIDDVTIQPLPGCPRVENIAVSNLTSESADIHWTEMGTATSYVAEYGPAGFTPGQGTLEYVYDTILYLSGLNANTEYDVYITVDCGSAEGGMNQITFRTACTAIDSLPFTMDFEGISTGSTTATTFIPCWGHINNGTSYFGYPYVSSSTAANNHTPGGSNYLYWYGSTTTGTYGDYYAVVLPAVDTDVYSISSLQLKFWSKATSTSYHPVFYVGVMSDPDDINSFQPVDTINVNPGSSTDWAEFTTDFDNFSGYGQHVAIRANRPTTSWYASVDDITLRVAPTCFEPTAVTLAAVDSGSATITWTPDSRSTVSAYYCEYGPAGFTQGEGLIETVYDDTLSLYGLNANTQYTVYITTECANGDASYPVRFDFRTACGGLHQADLPYTYGFEDASGSGAANTINPCWNRVTNYTTNYPYPYTTAARTGSYGLYFYSTTAYYSCVAMPAYNDGVENLRVKFWSRASSASAAYGRLEVGVMTNPNDINTFEPVILTQNATTTWEQQSVDFSSYTGTGKFIAFRNPATATGYTYLDDIELSLMPNCRPAHTLTANNVTTSSADLTWVNASVDPVNQYTVAVSSNSNFNPATCTTTYTVYDTNLSLTGLTQYTRYYWAVRSDCGTDSSDWSSVAEFVTPLDCGVGGINVMDTIGTGTSAISTVAFYPSTTYPYATDFIIFTAEELAEMGLYSNNRINSISLHTGTTGGTLNNISVYMAETANNVFATTGDTMHTAQMQQHFSGNMTFAANSWNEIVLDSAFNYSGTGNLMIQLRRDVVAPAAVTFYYTSTSPNYRTLYRYRSSATATTVSVSRSYSRVNMAFNVCTTIPACERPDNVTMIDLQPTQAQLGWQGTAAQYEAAYGPAGFDPDGTAGTHQMLTATTVTLTGLSSQTNYDFYVRAHCSGGDTSEWSFVQHFFTPCVPMSLPYTEDFESYGSGSSYTISPCWTKAVIGTTTQYPYPYSTNAITGIRSLYFYAYRPSSTTTTPYSCYAALPLMDAAIDSLQVSFNVRRYATTTDYYTTRLLVGLMTDPTDISTFTAIDTIDLKNEPGSSVHGFEVSFAGHANLGNFIAFYDAVPPLYGTSTYTYSYVYLDDILVDYIPTCPRPTNVTVADSTITGVSAEVAWTDRATPAQGYELEYGPAGHPFGQGIRILSNSNPTILTGLQPSTQYDVYVRAICSAADSGDWSFATSFYTTCEAISQLPVTYDFENYAAGTGAEFPQCWTRINDATGTYNYYPYVYNSSSYAHSGSNCLYFYAPTSTTYASNMYAVLPEVDTNYYPANTLEVTFWGRGSATVSYDASIIVGMMSNPESAATFVPVDTIVMNSTLTEYTVSFANYAGQGSHIAFYKQRGSTAGYAYIDDITITQLSPCGRPDSLVVLGADATSAQIDWIDTVGANTWVIEYALNTFGATAQRVVTSSHPYTLTGLQPMSNYWVNVASICPTTLDTGGFARQQAEFFTTQMPATVPYYCNFEDSTERANWQFNSNNNVNWYLGALGASEGTHGLYISADNGATRGTNMSAIVNAVAYRDIQFDTTPSGYTVTFKVNVGGTTPSNYDGVAVLLVDPTMPVEASSTALNSPWGHINQINRGTTRRTNGWVEATVGLDGVSGVQRLVFYWFNQATGTTNFIGDPAAIDSIVVEPQSCVRPYGIYADHITPTTANVHWDGDPQAHYTVTWRVQGAAASTNLFQQVTGTHATLTGLTPNTSYYMWARQDCDTNSSSDWSINGGFTTACSYFSAIDTFYEDFDSYTGVVYNADGDMPNCWDAYTDGTYTYSMPHVVGSGSYWYTASGSNCLLMTSGTSTTYGENKYVRLPLFSEPLSTLTLSYWMCTESSTNGTLSVGYMTGENYETDFHAVKTIPASTATYHGSNTGLMPAGTGFYDTVSFENVQLPANAQYIAFKWVYTTSFYSCALDNIKVTSSSRCGLPQIVNTTSTYQSVDMDWTGLADTFDVAIMSNVWDDAVSPVATVAANTYQFTGLQPATNYIVGVRQHCDSLLSAWVTATVTTDSMPCFAPTNLHVESVTGTSATFGWTPADTSHHNWDIRLHNTTFDSIYTVTTNPATIGGLQAGVTYFATIRTLCGDAANIEGDWSDSIPVNPMLCPTVTGLDTTSVDFNQVVLHWNADSLAQSWIVEYGILGFNQGSGTTATVTAPTYTATGLTDSISYDFYVRAVCGTNWESENWQSLTVTTDQAPAVTYTVTGNASNPAYGTVTGGGRFAFDSTATLTAIPATGYHFTMWTDGVTANPRTVVVTSDTTLTADFAANQYTVLVSVNDASMGSAGIDQYMLDSVTVNYYTTVTLTATANNGYHFVSWSDGSTYASRNLTVVSDTNLVATFAANMYTITVDVNDTAMGSATGAGSYAYGTTATLTATANNGFQFMNWNDGNGDNPRTITVTGDANYTAIFDTVGSVVNYYTVTLTVNDEAMGFVTGAGSYVENSVITITANANAGYEFVNWSDDNTDAERTITVTSDITLMANFREVVDSTAILVLSVNYDEMGYVTINGAEATQYTGHLGESVSIAAVANGGYRFVEWSDHNTDAERTITLEAATTQLQAVFERNTGIDDVNATLSCTIYPNPAHSTANISVSGVNGQVRIAVLDMSGRVIVNDANVSDNYVLDLQGLAAGTYFVRVVSEEASMVKKLIVR